jgi:sulfur carrier protein ThiS
MEEKHMASSIWVTVGQLGQPAEQVALEACATVRDALDAVDMDADRMTVSVNGCDATPSTVLSDNARITVSQKSYKAGC